MRALPWVLALLPLAWADAQASPPAPTTLPDAPIAGATYSPRSPLPAGLTIAPIEKKWYGPGFIASWTGVLGENKFSVDVASLPPRPKRALSAWARGVWGATHGSLREWRRADVRTWRGPNGRIAESDMHWGGGETDPSWVVHRFEERPGSVLHVRVQVAGIPNAAMRTMLREVFVDGPLGPRPR